MTVSSTCLKTGTQYKLSINISTSFIKTIAIVNFFIIILDMKYLLYYIDGFIKKFPLEQPVVTIGRNHDNSLNINDRFLSRNHLKITVKDESIMIQDLNSKNGTFIDQKPIEKGEVKIGESFSLGSLEFFLKQGDMEEFEPTKELIPIFNTMQKDIKNQFVEVETRYIKDIYSETLKQILKTGLSRTDFNDFLLDLSNFLYNLADAGSFFLVTRQKKEINILLTIKKKSGALEQMKELLNGKPDIFNREGSLFSPGGKDSSSYYAFPVRINKNPTVLLYFSNESSHRKNQKIEKFLSTLVKEIELVSQFFSDKPKTIEPLDYSVDSFDEFIASNSNMKEILLQAKRIARSDMFVLIQGESGTGKELLARLIHKHSERQAKKIIGINCAAIPENLLESELFGYEKGAFTGAYGQKKGKLEIASGSTLILDEIGDMPLNLQSKLLRALQENEFYRLGGNNPIKVNLRIISTTNKNLKNLIAEKHFREDLYYRLVHRTLTIPPLRERPDDISILINHFTTSFCQQYKKSINGYSVKAFEALQNYTWKGNVRQLKNEINSIINLTDSGEMITFDILSEEIKYDDELKSPTIQILKPEQSEKDIIYGLLKKNNWNKSVTARALNMTYQGLHKKMKRLDIIIPGKNERENA